MSHAPFPDYPPPGSLTSNLRYLQQAPQEPKTLNAQTIKIGPTMKTFVILGNNGEPYLTRHVLEERADGSRTYLHIIHQSDARIPHDHPWPFRSYIVSGSYIEHTPQGQQLFKAGDWNIKEAEDQHFLEIVEGPVITVLYRGAGGRNWGFYTEEGWVAHEEYLDKLYGSGNWLREHE